MTGEAPRSIRAVSKPSVGRCLAALKASLVFCDIVEFPFVPKSSQHDFRHCASRDRLDSQQHFVFGDLFLVSKLVST